jgi:hypothetical protein
MVVRTVALRVGYELDDGEVEILTELVVVEVVVAEDILDELVVVEVVVVEDILDELAVVVEDVLLVLVDLISETVSVVVLVVVVETVAVCVVLANDVDKVFFKFEPW